MSFNGSGTFLINTAGQPVVSGTVISSTAFNALTADLATGLSTAITKDGQTTVTANIPMSTYKFTGLGAGSAATDSANLSQVQSTVTKLLNSVSGADTITATASPTLAAYAAGQMFYFVAAGDNTTSVTLNIDSLGAKAVTRDGATALAAADIKSGEVVVVVYDGTRFQVVSQLNSAGDARFANVSIASSLYVGGVSTFVGNAGFSANVSIASALSVGGVAAITGATTIGGNLTLSGGTANGVLYLNGSKVATSGSALTFDGTGFSVGGASTSYPITSYATAGALGMSIIGRAADNVSLFTFFANNGSTQNAKFTAGTNYLATDVGGSEQTRLTTTGLGIGTASPAYKLHVERPSYGVTGYFFTNDGTRNPRLVIYGSADGTTLQHTYSTAAGNLIFANGGAIGSGNEVGRFDASGNLGIGTTSPVSGGLTIGNDGNSSGTPKLAFSTGLTERASLQMSGGSGEMRMTAGYAGYGGFATFYTNGSERMRLDSGGNLGIGTASPAYKLDVSGSLRTTSFWALTGSPAGAGGSVRYIGGGGSSTNWYTNVPTGGSQFWAINESPVMTLDSSGNLGIGTVSPGARLHVELNSTLIALFKGSNASVGAQTKVVTSADTGITTLMYGPSYTGGSVFNVGASGGVLVQDSNGPMAIGTFGVAQPLLFGTNSVERMRLDTSGNLGIGTTSPVVKLEVTGNVRIQNSGADSQAQIFGPNGFASFVRWGEVAAADKGVFGYAAGSLTLQYRYGATSMSTGTLAFSIDGNGNVVAGGNAALATTATNGFLYVPTCAGTPTGTPTAITGMAPIVVNTTNNKLYFYSGGAWRDAGP